MKILITSAGNKVWLVKAFRDAMFNTEITVQDTGDYVSSSFFSDERIDKIVKKDKFDFICYTRNAEILEASKTDHKNLPSYRTCLNCIDKHEFAKFCIANDFEIPLTLITERLFYKPIDGSGSKGIGSIDGKDRIFQEFIDWPEYTIDVFIHPDGIPISAVPRSRLKVVDGESWVSRTVKDHNLIAAGIDICVKMGLIWQNTVQCFYNGKDIRYIEINPRFAGGTPLSIAAGANSPFWIIQILQGKKVKPQIGKFKDGLTMIKYTEEVFF